MYLVYSETQLYQVKDLKALINARKNKRDHTIITNVKRWDAEAINWLDVTQYDPVIHWPVFSDSSTKMSRNSEKCVICGEAGYITVESNTFCEPCSQLVPIPEIRDGEKC